MTDMHQLSVTNAVKEFVREDGKRMRVLNDVSLSFPSAQVTSLVGPSGCGKTTLLNAIASVESLTSGSIEFSDENGERIARPHLGYVFQSPRLLPWKTVGANVALGLKGAGVPRSEWAGRVDRYLDLVNLLDFRDQYPLALSGGMRQRVGLARALAIEANIVLMDEPFASVDEITARNLRETTRALCEKLQRTVVFVTHNLSEAAFLSDMVVVLSGRPATIKAMVPDDLPGPREWGSPEVYHLTRELERLVMSGSDSGGELK
jgi:ABC-type nitrate/sulfonate/bicarbonate transport system ATPase subunit